MSPKSLLQRIALAAATLALAACAGTGQVRKDADVGTVVSAPAPAAVVAPEAPANTPVVAAVEAPATQVVTPAPPTDTTKTETAAPTAAEDDFAALYGQQDGVADSSLPPAANLPMSYDPWEPFNRKMHDVNLVLDRVVLKPVATFYVKILPRPVRLGIGNFFNNLGEPVSALNALLQGRPKDAGWSILRFGVNSTIGIGGILDPATRMGIPQKQEDFGQTLAVWGWRRSRYLELPLFGPRTVRDVFGMLGDSRFAPISYLGNAKTQAALRTLQVVDIRSRLFSVDAMRENVADEYMLYRDAWLQRRNYQILRDTHVRDAEDEGLPDYLDEAEDNPSIPANSIPINP